MPDRIYSVGIDIGVSGAICIREDNPDGIVTWDVTDLPVYVIKRKSELNLHAFADILRHVGNKARAGDKVFAVLERVSAMPKQGVSSTFKFGYTAGAINAMLCAFEIPHRQIPPTEWKKFWKIPPKSGKDASRQSVHKHYPTLRSLTDRKLHHNRADAILMAAYARTTVAQLQE